MRPNYLTHILIITLIIGLSTLIWIQQQAIQWQWQVQKKQKTGENLSQLPIERLTPISGQKPAFQHAVSLSHVNGDQVIASWYGGSGEHHPDVKLFTAIYDNKHWHRPRIALTRSQVIKQQHRFIHTIGNPVIHCKKKHCELYFVTTFGGWSTAHINVMHSSNGGQSWSDIRLLVSSPLLNLSTLLRAHAVPMTGQQTMLPAYQELGQKSAIALILSKQQHIIAIRWISPDHMSLQPVIIPITAKYAWALMRHAKTKHIGHIIHYESHDGGQHWQQQDELAFNNPDSGLSAIKIKNSIWLAYNPDQQDRQRLFLTHYNIKRGRWAKTAWRLGSIKKNNKKNHWDYFYSYPDLLALNSSQLMLALSTKNGIQGGIYSIGGQP